MIVFFRYLHYLDRITTKIEEKHIQGEKALKYTDSVIQEIFSKENTREYTIDNKSEVFNYIDNIIKNPKSDDVPKLVNKIAKKLLKEENITQQEIENFIELQKGALLQAYLKEINTSEDTMYILCKIDFSAYVDEDKFEDHRGLPKKQKVYKSCIFHFSQNNLILITLFDISSKIAKYWSEGFLELSPIVDDTTNTKNLLHDVKVIINQYTMKSHDDRKALLNCLYRYLESNDSYSFTSFIEYLLNSYEPRNETLNFNDFKKKIIDSCKQLERNFGIDKEILKTELVEKNVEVNEKISITIKGVVDQQPNIIKSYEKDGTKYLQIKTTNDDLYKRFLELK